MMLHYIPSRLLPTSETLTSNLGETLLNLELRSLAFVGVNCFILISGYFGINWKLKSCSSLFFRIIYWSLISFLLAMLLTTAITGNGFQYSGSVFSNIFTIRWFIGAYVCLYLIAPLLNAFIERVEKRQYATFIIAFYAVSTLFGWVLKSSEFNEGMNALSLAGLYLIGAFVKKYPLRLTQYNRIIDLIIYLALGLFLVLGSVAALEFGITKSLYGYLNPIVIIQSVYLFLFFSKQNLGSKRVINIIAASAFSAYLLHTDICSRPIWYSLCQTINEYGAWLSLPLFILLCATVFAACIVFDYVGNSIFNKAFSLFSRLLHHDPSYHIRHI